MIAHKRIRNGYIIDDRDEPIPYPPPVMFITETITDEDYYPLPADRGKVVQLLEEGGEQKDQEKHPTQGTKENGYAAG